jgi:hypothetical protein
MDQDLKDYLVAMESRIDAKIEKVETTLLTEFHKWASPAEIRGRTHAAVQHAIDLDMEISSDRVQKREGPPVEIRRHNQDPRTGAGGPSFTIPSHVPQQGNTLFDDISLIPAVIPPSYTRIIHAFRTSERKRLLRFSGNSSV